MAKPGDADGGVDIRTTRALAQVKYQAFNVGRPELQKLFGARGHASEKQLIFFTGSDYASTAVAYGNEHDIALFRYDVDGSMMAINASARRLIDSITAGSRANPVPLWPRASLSHQRIGATSGNNGRRFWKPHWRLVVGLLFLYLPISHLMTGAIGSRFEFAFSFSVFWAFGSLLVRSWWIKRRGAASASATSGIESPKQRRLGVVLAAVFAFDPFVSIEDNLVYKGPFWLDILKFVGILTAYWAAGLALLAWARGIPHHRRIPQGDRQRFATTGDDRVQEPP